jgi:hypothetical protein
MIQYETLKRWWGEEIGRTTLSVAGDTITVDNLPIRKYLNIIIRVVPTGGTIQAQVRFNNDSGNNYNRLLLSNWATVANNTSLSSLILIGALQDEQISYIDISNLIGYEKTVSAWTTGRGVAGATNLPRVVTLSGKWINTASQINRIDVVNGGTGDFATGSELIVMGHD